MTSQDLFAFIQQRCIILSKDRPIIGPGGARQSWLIDLRPLLLNSGALAFVSSHFWNVFEAQYPFQVGCRELAAVPLLGAIIAEGQRRSKPIEGFIVRKSRKKTGLQQGIEGHPSERPLILIDDLINTGSSLRSVLAALEKEPTGPIIGVFTVVKYRDRSHYSFLPDQAHLSSLFSLEEFGLSLGESQTPPRNPNFFKREWVFSSPNPNHSYVLPKSGPVLDSTHVYFGSDSGFFWAIDKATGEPVWKFKVGKTASGKEIFSTPVIWKNFVYFGSYDGNTYALDTRTGALRWRARGADAVGSSPTLAPDRKCLFIGLEHGLFRRRGSVAALDLHTGEERWHSPVSPEFIHATPAYSKKFGLVAVGANDYALYALDAGTGSVCWSARTGGEIKGGTVFDEKRGLVITGSFDGALYFFDAATGSVKGKFQTENVLFTTPVLTENSVLIASEDANLYRINLDSGALEWKFAAEGRIMAAPLVIGGEVFIGANDGRFYALDAKSGTAKGFFQGSERITNQATYDAASKRFFVVNTANQLCAFTKFHD